MTDLFPIRSTLERVAYSMVVRTAARLGGAFKPRDPGRQMVVVLRIAEGADLDEHVVATRLLVGEVTALKDFTVIAPKIRASGLIDHQRLRNDLKAETSVLMLWPAGHEIPRKIQLAADRVVCVGQVRPHHLVAAVKQFTGQNVELQDATKMMSYPLRDVFDAFRVGRPPSAVLAALAQVARSSPSSDPGLRLGDVVGYGEAKRWALALAKDFEAWKRGLLDWSDVDRGLLLSGPPGTGKTMFAGVVAKACKAHLVAVQWPGGRLPGVSTTH